MTKRDLCFRAFLKAGVEGARRLLKRIVEDDLTHGILIGLTVFVFGIAATLAVHRAFLALSFLEALWLTYVFWRDIKGG